MNSESRKVTFPKIGVCIKKSPQDCSYGKALGVDKGKRPRTGTLYRNAAGTVMAQIYKKTVGNPNGLFDINP